MIISVEAEEFMNVDPDVAILDVRSPGEYNRGHIPNAVSFPLFSDEERAVVGTIYKQIGKKDAIEKGLQLVQPKIQKMWKQGMDMAKEGKLKVHCWRGGQRSLSVANLMSLSGAEVKVLEGGYKTFRRWVLEKFEEKFDFRVIGGMTGVGKTEILHLLAEKGEQILDLEGLADHRGSSFGHLGSAGKVTLQNFENKMAVALNGMKKGRIWVEDESRGIGSLIIPIHLWEQMTIAPVWVIDLPDEARIERLSVDYGSFAKEDIRDAILKIKKFLGGRRCKEALEAVEKGDTNGLVTLLLQHYDKMYAYGLSKRTPKQMQTLKYERFDAERIVQELIDSE